MFYPLLLKIEEGRRGMRVRERGRVGDERDKRKVGRERREREREREGGGGGAIDQTECGYLSCFFT